MEGNSMGVLVAEQRPIAAENDLVFPCGGCGVDVRLSEVLRERQVMVDKKFFVTEVGFGHVCGRWEHRYFMNKRLTLMADELEVWKQAFAKNKSESVLRKMEQALRRYTKVHDKFNRKMRKRLGAVPAVREARGENGNKS